MKPGHVRAFALLLAFAASTAVAAPAPTLRKAPDFTAPRLDSAGSFTLSGHRGVPSGYKPATNPKACKSSA
jgi:hypothetical protein